MDKIKLPLRRSSLVVVFLSLYLSVFADSEWYIGAFSHSEIEQRLNTLSSDIDFKLNSDVKKYLDQFVVHYKHSSETLIGRTMYYYPIIEEKIIEKNIPDEIKNLVIIESSLNPLARSRAGATGMWQFMRTTGKMYGLTINSVIDERKNVEKSTEAALTYLTELYDRFGDWTLALAAYNCGPGNVSKAMRRSGGKDYWSIRNYLPRETRNYIPKFIAATYLMNYYSDHGIIPEYQEELFTHTRTAIIYEKTSFRKISQLTGLEMEVISKYNPEYVGKFIPKNEKGRALVLPSNEMFTFLERIDAFHLLEADPFEEVNLETKVAAEKIERKEMLEEIEYLNGIDGLLTNFGQNFESSSGMNEIKLTSSMKLRNSMVTLTENYDANIPQKDDPKDRKRFFFRKDKGAVSESK